jgi:hypothetical protein
MSTPPPLLVVRYRNSSAQVGRLLGGITFKQIGSDLPVGVESTTSTTSMTNCRAVQFQNKIYAYQKDRIYCFDEGTIGDWVEVHQAVSQDSTAGFGFHSGIHVLQVSGVPTMVAFYRNTPNFDLQALHSTDGTSWTLYDTNVSTGSNLIGRSLVFRNQVYIWFNHSVDVGLIRYDPTNPSTGTILTDAAGDWEPGFSKDFCVFNDELYGVGQKVGTAGQQNHRLKRLVGDEFILAATLTGRNSDPSDTNAAFCLFTDGINMYAFTPGRNSGGTQRGTIADQLAPNGASFIVTQITSTVIPSHLDPISEDTHRWFSFLDNDTDPDDPTITIWSQSPTGVNAYVAYTWNGPGAAMTTLGTGPAEGLALPHSKDGGGEYIWTSGEPSVEIIDTSPDVDSQTVSFIAYSSEVTGTFKVRLWYDGEETFAKTSATLMGPVTGGGSLGSDTTGDFVDEVVADGVTVHTVVWDVVADGFAKGSSVILMPTISL